MFRVIRYKSFWRGVFVGVVLASLAWISIALEQHQAMCQLVIEKAAQPDAVPDDWANRVWHENFISERNRSEKTDDGTNQSP